MESKHGVSWNKKIGWGWRWRCSWWCKILYPTFFLEGHTNMKPQRFVQKWSQADRISQIPLYCRTNKTMAYIDVCLKVRGLLCSPPKSIQNPSSHGHLLDWKDPRKLTLDTSKSLRHTWTKPWFGDPTKNFWEVTHPWSLIAKALENWYLGYYSYCPFGVLPTFRAMLNIQGVNLKDVSPRELWQ